MLKFMLIIGVATFAMWLLGWTEHPCKCPLIKKIVLFYIMRRDSKGTVLSWYLITHCMEGVYCLDPKLDMCCARLLTDMTAEEKQDLINCTLDIDLVLQNHMRCFFL